MATINTRQLTYIVCLTSKYPLFTDKEAEPQWVLQLMVKLLIINNKKQHLNQICPTPESMFFLLIKCLS